MQIVRRDGSWVILHGGREIRESFETEEDAWAWADEHIDDQVFGGPNRFSAPLVYAENVQ